MRPTRPGQDPTSSLEPTATLPLPETPRDVDETLPFLKVPTPEDAENDLPALQLAEYASLCAELAMFPEERARAQERYGIADEPMHRRIDDHFRHRFARDAAMRGKWQDLYGQYLVWLRQHASTTSRFC